MPTADRILAATEPNQQIHVQNWGLSEIRNKSHKSLFYFAKNVLNYTKLITTHHGSQCRIIKDTSKQYILNLHPRGTYKSSIWTISYPLWYLLTQNSKFRFLIVSKKDLLAREYLRAIKFHLETNELLIALYGYQVSDKWTEGEIILQCRGNTQHKEPNVKAIGLDAEITGGHFDVIIFDDIVTKKDWESSQERIRTQNNFIKFLSTLESHTRVIVNGTRWHIKDIYYHIEHEMNPRLSEDKKFFILKSSLETAEGKSDYPEIYSDADLADIKARVSPYIYSANYLNNPIPDDTRIYDLTKLNYFKMSELNISRMEIYKACDPAFGDSKSACYAPILTIAYDRTASRMYLIDVDMKQRTFQDLIQAIIDNMLRIPCNIFFGETNFNQAAYFEIVYQRVKEWERTNGKSLNYNFQSVINSVKKEVRITQMQPKLREVFFRDDWRNLTEYRELMDQLEGFPIHDFFDGPDCLELLISAINTGYGAMTLKVDSIAKRY